MYEEDYELKYILSEVEKFKLDGIFKNEDKIFNMLSRAKELNRVIEDKNRIASTVACFNYRID